MKILRQNSSLITTLDLMARVKVSLGFGTVINPFIIDSNPIPEVLQTTTLDVTDDSAVEENEASLTPDQQRANIMSLFTGI